MDTSLVDAVAFLLVEVAAAALILWRQRTIEIKTGRHTEQAVERALTNGSFRQVVREALPDRPTSQKLIEALEDRIAAAEQTAKRAISENAKQEEQLQALKESLRKYQNREAARIKHEKDREQAEAPVSIDDLSEEEILAQIAPQLQPLPLAEPEARPVRRRLVKRG